MFFFQDNIGYLIRLSQTPFWQWIVTPEAEHFLPITNAFLFLEHKLFGFNFYPYLFVSVLLHLINCLLVYKLTRYLTRSSFWAILAFSFFCINLTYTEPILWNLQGLLLSTLFLGSAFFFWLRFLENVKSNYFIYSVIFLSFSGLSYGLGIGTGFLFAAITFIYPRIIPKTKISFWRKVVITYLILGITSIIIGPITSRGLIQHITPQITVPFLSSVKYLAFVIAGIARGVIGRFFLPGLEPSHVEILPTVISFIPALITILLVVWFLKSKAKNYEKFRLLTLIVFICFPYFWSGIVRYHFGLKQALAERYAYPALFFFVIYLSLILQKLIDIKIYKNKILLAAYAFMLISLQSIFFIKNTYIFEEKPAKTKEYITNLQLVLYNEVPVLDLPLPSYINQEYRISQLAPLISEELSVNFVKIDSSFCSTELRESLEDRQILDFYTQQAIDPAVSQVFNLEKLRECLFHKD